MEFIDCLELKLKEDAGIKYGEILIGNLKDGYVANIQEDISIYTEDHIKNGKQTI